MQHVYAFVLVMAAGNGVLGYLEWLRIKMEWNVSGSIIPTIGFFFHVVIFVWATTLLLKVFPGIPLC